MNRSGTPNLASRGRLITPRKPQENLGETTRVRPITAYSSFVSACTPKRTNDGKTAIAIEDLIQKSTAMMNANVIVRPSGEPYQLIDPPLSPNLMKKVNTNIEGVNKAMARSRVVAHHEHYVMKRMPDLSSERNKLVHRKNVRIGGGLI